LRIKATQRIEHIISIYNRGKEYRISTALRRYPAIGYQATRIRTREHPEGLPTRVEYDPEGLPRTRVTNTTPKGYEHEKRIRPRRVTNARNEYDPEGLRTSNTTQGVNQQKIRNERIRLLSNTTGQREKRQANNQVACYTRTESTCVTRLNTPSSERTSCLLTK
jgi:hypothetical protein